MKNIILTGKNLTISQVDFLVNAKETKIIFEKQALNKVKKAHKFLNQTLGQNNKIIYGVNTGFGPMANYILANDQILDLQNNLILSHAVGLGQSINEKFVHAAMIIRMNTLLNGHSAISPELLQQLRELINLKILPVVPEHGAVGTSGDLVQLAHIALTLLGKGEAYYKNKKQKVATIFKQTGLKPYRLKPKEGLSLINGTSMMTGIASLVCWDSRNLLSLAVRNGCLALEIVKAYEDSFSEKLHQLRPHTGQRIIAEQMRRILKNSPLIRSRSVLAKHANHGNTVNKINESVQEIYSLRCTAQILGPIYETLTFAWKTTETEMNSVTDNPIVDWKNNKFLHGGNFHGDYVSVAMDQLKISLVKLTMLSERRLNFFLNHKVNQFFPPFLNLDTPGLTLGLQAMQFVATSTTAQSQTLAYPMNLHSISTNGDNQDVVSMGTDSALLAQKIQENCYIVQTIELFALCQAVDYLNISSSLSPESKKLFKFVRSHIKKLVNDREIQAELGSFLSEIPSWPEINLFTKF
jgi:histidine ammonia-lyase